MRKALLAPLLMLLAAIPAGAQIVNRLGVDAPTFERYAYGRMQPYSGNNLALADSIYREGVRKDSDKYKCLALSLDFPVRFALGEYEAMDADIAEMKTLIGERKDCRSFYYSCLHEYCQYLVHIGRSDDAMLEARAMERTASQERLPLGKMFASRIVGLIHSYRDNPHLAIVNLEKAVRYSIDARAEQDLPNLYIIISQEYIKMGNFERAEEYCEMAEEYQDFLPGIRIKALMTRCYYFYARQDWNGFWACYDQLQADPLYLRQADGDSRSDMDVCYLVSKGRFDEALAAADRISTSRERHSRKHGIYAAQGVWQKAYAELSELMVEKDSIYIKVQNEDLAILDAEMNNAQLREDAQRLKAQNQMTILIGFLVMFAIAFFAILLSQWQLRQNLDEMRRKNAQMLASRRAFQKAMEAKEAENEFQIKILQNRTTNRLTGYEDYLDI